MSVGEAGLGRPEGHNRTGNPDQHDKGEAVLRVRLQAIYDSRRALLLSGQGTTSPSDRDVRGALSGSGAPEVAVSV